MNTTTGQQKPLIIFDWDGTLMDSIGLIVASMQQVAHAYHLNITDEQIKSIIGLSLNKAMPILFPQLNDIAHQELIAGYSEYYIANSHTTPLFVDIEPLLQDLLDAGKTLAVATGKRRIGLDRVMASSQTAQYFAATRCADESASKPAPKMLTDILAQLGYTPADAVFVGDSVHDIQMATALNMVSIGVSYGAASRAVLAQSQPTRLVDTVAQLRQVLLG